MKNYYAKYYVGLDVSNETTKICILNQKGKIVKEMNAMTNPESIDAALRATNLRLEAIGLETGAVSDWLIEGLRKRSWRVICLDAFKMSKLISMNVNKTDRNDARMIAEAIRIHCLSNINLEVHTKSSSSRVIRTLIKIRQSILHRRTGVYNEIRGILKGYGIQMAPVKPAAFCNKVTQVMKGLPPLLTKGLSSLLSTYETMSKEIDSLSDGIETIAEQNKDVEILRKEPGIGATTALYFIATIDDPTRFKDSKAVGAYAGLTPSQYSSGESEKQNGISKRGDKVLRSLLFECATTVLFRSKKKSALKAWGLKILNKKGSKIARAAIARKLAVRMHVAYLKKQPYMEKAPKPKRKHECLKFSTEELLRLADISKGCGGCINIKNANQLKPLARVCEKINQ